MKARVLAVDDTPSLRALLQLVLTRAGYEAVMAEDGEQAAGLYAGGGFDAVIMDVHMPVLDGLAAAARMRTWERESGRRPAPILALSAGTEAPDERRCLEAGFSAAVRKPFSRETLLAALERELGANGPGIVEVSVDPEIADLAPDFLRSARAGVETMRAALRRGDVAEVAAPAHKLVGAGASYGFSPISEHARRAEAAAKAGDAAGAAAAVEDLAAYLAKVKVVLP